jgi:hypothetical protein
MGRLRGASAGSASLIHARWCLICCCAPHVRLQAGATEAMRTSPVGIGRGATTPGHQFRRFEMDKLVGNAKDVK